MYLLKQIALISIKLDISLHRLICASILIEQSLFRRGLVQGNYLLYTACIMSICLGIVSLLLQSTLGIIVQLAEVPGVARGNFLNRIGKKLNF